MHLNDLLVHRVLKFNCAPDWYWDKRPVCPWPTVHYRSHGDNYFWNYNLWCVLSGNGTLKTDHKQWALKRGDVFLLRGNEAYFGEHNPGNPLKVTAIHFDFQAKNKQPLTPKGLPFYRHFSGMQFLEELLVRIESTWRSRQVDSSAIWTKACLTEFVNIETKTPSDPKNDQIMIIRAICDEICTDPGRQHIIADFANRTHCSLRHFNRLFKQFTDTTPQAFILEARLEKAKDILLSSSHSINRIAELTGFNDIYYFSKWFKDKTGLPPSKYRQSSSLKG